jgi:hypothetical protein
MVVKMFDFLRPLAKKPKPRKTRSASIFGLEDGYIYCALNYEYRGLRILSKPDGRVDIAENYVEDLGRCALEAFNNSGHYDPNSDEDRPFIFSELSQYTTYKEFDAKTIEMCIDEWPDGTLRVVAADPTRRRAKIGGEPIFRYFTSESSALTVGQTIIEAERPYREIMMATKWKKKTAKPEKAPP